MRCRQESARSGLASGIRTVPCSMAASFLGSAAGELRRHALDLIRQGRPREAEAALQWMEDIFSVLVTVDFPDAITGGLRRTADMVRGVLERTRGDVTLMIKQEELMEAMRRAKDEQHR